VGWIKEKRSKDQRRNGRKEEADHGMNRREEKKKMMKGRYINITREDLKVGHEEGRNRSRTGGGGGEKKINWGVRKGRMKNSGRRKERGGREDRMKRGRRKKGGGREDRTKRGPEEGRGR
jgi:hypothetical protein